jgi:hypothetical protein
MITQFVNQQIDNAHERAQTDTTGRVAPLKSRCLQANDLAGECLRETSPGDSSREQLRKMNDRFAARRWSVRLRVGREPRGCRIISLHASMNLTLYG